MLLKKYDWYIFIWLIYFVEWYWFLCKYIDVFWFIVRMCVRLFELMNGYVNYIGFFLGFIVIYSCKCGYKLIGLKVRYC